MLTLITGGSASGKSLFAETMLMEAKETRKIYMATMFPWDEESRTRIQKHRNMRNEKGFETIECYDQLDCWQSSGQESTVILLECMSNLVANEQYVIGGTAEEICERVMAGILHLQKQAHSIIIVTNEVFSHGDSYEKGTMEYLQILGQVNQRLGKMAEKVIEVVYGIPVLLKHKG